jgi:DNA-binding Lrp family transcriptional regulator
LGSDGSARFDPLILNLEQPSVSSICVLEVKGKWEGGDPMAAKAFVLIEATVGKTREVIAALDKVEGVKSVEAVTGPHDVIAVIEMPDVNAIADLVTKNIHSISGIARTVTCLTVRLESGC